MISSYRVVRLSSFKTRRLLEFLGERSVGGFGSLAGRKNDFGFAIRFNQYPNDSLFLFVEGFHGTVGIDASGQVGESSSQRLVFKSKFTNLLIAGDAREFKRFAIDGNRNGSGPWCRALFNSSATKFNAESSGSCSKLMLIGCPKRSFPLSFLVAAAGVGGLATAELRRGIGWTSTRRSTG